MTSRQRIFRWWFALTLLGGVSLSTTVARTVAEPVAFPQASGWGKNARGGRDAKTKILFVTSLADSGPGTLREALEKTRGPRIILFKTGGVIALKSKLSFREGYVTIAGQTAPGDGIIVKNFPIRIGANHVIMRGLRIRNGDGPGPAGDLRDSIQIGRVNGELVHDVIVDHCSFGWSMDETMEFWYGAKDVTVSNCILSEALWKSQHEKGSHGYALLFGNGACTRITLYQNLFAHNERRNPWIKDNAQVEIVNNVLYNWGTEAIGLWCTEAGKQPASALLIGNYCRGGEASGSRRGINLAKIAVPGSRFYLKGNIGPGRPSDTGDEWADVGIGTGVDAASYRANAPIPGLDSGIAAKPASLALTTVLAGAGALPRDAADRRAVADARNGTGRHIDTLAQIGGYPDYAPGTYPKDSDSDGIPDDWETTHGLNPRDGNDAARPSKDGSGYLNVEVYINSLLQ
jgi:hypothetical protein